MAPNSDTTVSFETFLVECSRAITQVGSLEEVAQTVCDCLVATGRYRSAVIGRVDHDGRSFHQHANTGAERFRPFVTDGGTTAGGAIAVDSVQDAVRTGALQTDEFRIEAADAGRATPDTFRGTVATVPLGDRNHGCEVLVVETDCRRSVDSRERALFEATGRLVGLAFERLRARRHLHADSYTELEFQIDDPRCPLVGVTDDGATLSLDGYIPARGRWLAYIDISGVSTQDVASRFVRDRDVETVKEITSGRIALSFTEGSIFHRVASLGGSITLLTVTSDQVHVGVAVPERTEIRQVTDPIFEAYENATLVAVRDGGPEPGTLGRPTTVLAALTDRQRNSLEAAYQSGYFDWPRESTASEVAESLGISRATFHGHLRKAQRKVFEELVEEPSTGSW